MDIPIYYALLGGAISFLSPCVLPLVPPYLCYMAGSTVSDLTGSEDTPPNSQMRKKAIFQALLFVIGFSVVFVSLGASASLIGKLLLQWSTFFAKVAGVVIIVMGLHFVGLFKIEFLQREARFQVKGSGSLGSFAMGLAFAFGWAPCIGPILAPILTLAGSSNSVGQGAFLLGVYSAGLGIPFILAAIFVGSFIGFFNKFKKYLGYMEIIVGILLIITGIMFLFGWMQEVAFWMLEAFPALSTIEGVILKKL